MSRYSPVVVDHFTSPRNQGQLDKPDFVGLAGTPGQGRYFVLRVCVREGHIDEVRFQSHGCGATIAAGSMLTELIRGQTIAKCRELTERHLTEALGGLPPDKAHCVPFVLQALSQILGQAAS